MPPAVDALRAAARNSPLGFAYHAQCNTVGPMLVSLMPYIFDTSNKVNWEEIVYYPPMSLCAIYRYYGAILGVKSKQYGSLQMLRLGFEKCGGDS